MDHSRKANREGNEKTLQYKSRQESLLDEEFTEDKLTELLASISQLDQTPPGADELQRRTKALWRVQTDRGRDLGPVLRSAATLVGPGNTADEIAAPCSEADGRIVRAVQQEKDRPC